MTSISKPSKPSETHGEAPPPTWRSERWCARNPSYAVNGALTSVTLRDNKLGDEGWGAVFAAICGNKDSKIMSMDASC